MTVINPLQKQVEILAVSTLSLRYIFDFNPLNQFEDSCVEDYMF
jgi:hypothetical protein